jgi:hypothetical protein
MGSKKKSKEAEEKKEGKMSWRLKATENSFQVTRDGPFEYRTFKHGEIYTEIPEEEADRFELIEEE